MEVLFEIIKAIIFGIVEGVTEWLPVSSTGHMIILQDFIRLNVSPAFWKIFEVVIQLGAIMAVVLLYRRRLLPIKKDDDGLKIKMGTIELWIKIIVACLPAAVVGIAFDDLIDEYLYKTGVVASALIIVGVMFILVESLIVENHNVDKLSDITYKDALLIGVFQLLAAIFPGTSRSGATIIGGLIMGLSRKTAAEFTFFLAIPVMFGASFLKVVKYWISGGIAFTVLEVAILVVGTITAFIVSLLVIGYLMNFIKKKSFKGFGWYRILVGIGIIIYSIVTKS
ncbi:MAG: undecaprenyl-diphosphate phosphatase [Catonella sp.]|uniref:undecaprenyl-diphosphate phosphatase n=1 Tax=Catonella sp. TaxID=2382125 RepID=UPI003F9F75A2